MSNPVQAAAEGLPNEITSQRDQAIDIGVKIGEAMRAEESAGAGAYAAKAAKNSSAVTYYEKAGKHASDAYWAHAEGISLVKATTLTGAAIQVVQVSGLVETLWDMLPESVETYENKKAIRAIERLLFSILDVVDAEAIGKIADVVHPDYGSRYLNPWVPVEDGCEDAAKAEVAA